MGHAAGVAKAPEAKALEAKRIAAIMASCSF